MTFAETERLDNLPMQTAKGEASLSRGNLPLGLTLQGRDGESLGMSGELNS